MRTSRASRLAGCALITVLMSVLVISPAQAVGSNLVPSADAKVAGTITVSAAASLTDVFPVIAKAFQKRYPGTHVRFNFGGSSTLVNQIKGGAPVDVLATASEPTMWSAVKDGLVGKPLLFAKNTMAIAMPSDNPARIRSINDLTRPGTLVGVCAATVPCGTAARELFARNTVSVRPVTQELDVRSLLGKVISGDLDAAIVYATDVKAAGSKVRSISIPASLNVTTTYPVATVGSTANPVVAQRFVDYLRYSVSAQGILRAYGFAKPW
ncbi:MAG: molybdate ABC transporter substrate-binding protein [Candidatus Nanopelagicales bacterium]